MKEVRKQIAVQVERLKDQGVYTQWSDASDLLEPHDPHRVAFEGEEDAPIIVSDDDDDMDDDDVGGVGGGAGDGDGDDADAGEGDDGDDRPPGRGLSTQGGDGDSEHGGNTDDVGGDDDTPGGSAMGGAEVATTPPLTSLAEARFMMRSHRGWSFVPPTSLPEAPFKMRAHRWWSLVGRRPSAA